MGRQSGPTESHAEHVNIQSKKVDGSKACLCVCFTLRAVHLFLRAKFLFLRESFLDLRYLRCIACQRNEGKETDLCKQLSSVSPTEELPFIVPLALNSKLTSNMGSLALFTFPHLPHSTSLCNSPACVEWMTHTHEMLVEPRELAWIWLSSEIRHSCASCWDADAKSGRNW
jgi:hypothetical protein